MRPGDILLEAGATYDVGPHEGRSFFKGDRVVLSLSLGADDEGIIDRGDPYLGLEASRYPGEKKTLTISFTCNPADENDGFTIEDIEYEAVCRIRDFLNFTFPERK